jgi:DNA-binding XRE family transcriptional regulator
VKSVFGRPLRLATRAAGERFIATHYRRFAGQPACPPPLPAIPADYDQKLRTLRRRLRLTQGDLALRIGAAGKAVIYQWESRRRTPSPVLWRRILQLDLRNARLLGASSTDATSYGIGVARPPAALLRRGGAPSRSSPARDVPRRCGACMLAATV